MVADTSVLIAILHKEPGSARHLKKLTDAQIVLIGAPTLVETTIVSSNKLRHSGEKDQDSRPLVQALIKSVNADVIRFTEQHYQAATDAFLRFGKGRHPAGLNFGDCMSYAFATVSGEPLLYLGDDFAKTDILSA